MALTPPPPTSRRKSIVQTLVSTLEMKFDEESETNRLEAEIAEEEKPAPESRLSRFRRKGALIVHSKHILMLVVLLNVIDCLLVTGELILDIHYIKEVLEESDLASQRFVDQMQARYPDHLSGHDIDHLGLFHNAIYKAQCFWDEDLADICSSSIHSRSLLQVDDTDYSGNYAEELTVARAKEAHAQNSWVDVAHGMHKASIAILGVLFLENLFKIFCEGRRILKRKIEVFDALIVCASFTLDLVFLKGLTVYRIQDGVLVLSFLLPWRVIRVVNSLIVAIIDHEHFRLKMMYKEKKKLANDLDLELDKTSQMKDQLKTIEDFLDDEGMPRWKYIQFTHFDEKKTSVSSIVSEKLKGVMGGVRNFPCKPQLENISELGVTDKHSLNNNSSKRGYLDRNIAGEMGKHKGKSGTGVPYGNLNHRRNGHVLNLCDVIERSDSEDDLSVTGSSVDQTSPATDNNSDIPGRTDNVDNDDSSVKELDGQEIDSDSTRDLVTNEEPVHTTMPFVGYENTGFITTDEEGKRHNEGKQHNIIANGTNDRQSDNQQLNTHQAHSLKHSGHTDGVADRQTPRDIPNPRRNRGIVSDTPDTNEEDEWEDDDRVLYLTRL